MFAKTFCTFALVCLATLATPSAGLRAQSTQAGDTLILSLSEARRLAVDANPDLLTASWRPQAARADIRTAGMLRFNPEAVYESRSPGDGMASRFEAEVGVELELAGQRGLRGRASEASYASELRTFEDEARRVLADVGRGYQRLVAAEQRVVLVEEINSLNGQLNQAVQAQLLEGVVSVFEANLATIEAARAEARALEASSARVSAALELGRLLGLESSVPLRTSGPSQSSGVDEAQESLEERLRQALSSRPDLRALQFGAERARQEERLARRESFPNLRLAGLATREDPLADPRFGLAVGLELPLFNRNQGQTERLRAETAEIEQRRRATELRVQTEVEDALRVYTSARLAVEVLESELLAPVQENHGLLEIAYREGEIDLASLLLLRNELLDAELDYWSAWERRETARTDLESATGEILRGVSLTNRSDR